jgi:uracil-DNA glycosylase
MPQAADQLTLELEGVHKVEGRLQRWPPEVHTLDETWQPVVADFMASCVGMALAERLKQALSKGKTIYPAEPLRALQLTPLRKVRVVILGQDPYHGPGQAQGLAFSVAPGVRVPPSLRNIFKELEKNLGVAQPINGSLLHWAQQGVLLLNTSLTVEDGQAASHAQWGWASLTDALIVAVAQKVEPVVFMLWGAHAQSKKPLIDAAAGASRHLILRANHPSPLSALRPPQPFVGCGHFLQANQFMESHHAKPIQW